MPVSNRYFRTLCTLLCGLALLLSVSSAFAQTAVPVLTRSYNNQRTGANNQETVLTPSNVNSGQFGKLFSRPVDGEVYAQPLYVPNLSINGGTHNVLFVVTMHDSLYAFDADDPNASTPLWQTSYLQTVDGIHPVAVATSPIPTSDVGGGGYADISQEVGIISTPVIDPNTATLYLVSRTKEVGGSNGTYVQRLHAVNVYTGQDRIAPTVIKGSFPNSSGGKVFFDPLLQNQRPGLLLDHGNIYLAWASHGDSGGYHGWVMAYDAATLTQKAAFCSTPDSGQGGIWQSGQGPAADAAGNIYVVVGNGDSSIKNKPTPGTGFSEALVKMKVNGSQFQILDWFMPYNADNLNDADADSTLGPTLVPGPGGKTYAIMGSKSGSVYVMDTANLGKYNPNNPGSPQNDNQIIESFQVTTSEAHGSPAYFVGDTGTWIYVWGDGVPFKAYAYSGTSFNTTPSSQSTFSGPGGDPGGIMTLSSNGTKAGIVWVNIPVSQNANQQVVAGVLRAFDATDLTKELWNSLMSSGRDDFGNLAKYCPPIVTNGKVYMATFSNQVVAYGILPPPLAPTNLVATGGNQAVGLNWTAGPYASTYNIKRSPSSNGTYTTIATGVTTNSYTNTGLTNGTTYYYKVSGTNNLGTSDDSNIASATPVTPIIGNGTGLTGQYYVDPGDGTYFNTLTYARNDPTVNFNWNGSPPAPGVPGTNFSVRWTGQVMPSVSGVTTFTATADDGVRLWVNGQQLVDAWIPQSSTSYSGTINLTAGQQYDIKMEYFQAGGGAVAQLSWSYAGQTDTIIPATQLFPAQNIPQAPANLVADTGNTQIALTWTGASGALGYNLMRSLNLNGPFTTIAPNLTQTGYTDTGLTNGTTYYYQVTAVYTSGESFPSNVASGTPFVTGSGAGLIGQYFNDLGDGNHFTTLALTRIDPTINFNWGNGSPDPAVQSDNFSARWTGSVTPQFSETYTFYATGDDGIRLWVNNQLLIDQWHDQGPTEYSATITLTKNNAYPIKMEYYENGGGAVAMLAWSSAHVSKQIIPQTALSNTGLPVTVSGVVQLDSVVNAAQQITFVFRPSDNSGNLTFTPTLGADGSFSISGLSAKNYTLAVKGAKWLQAVTPLNTSLGSVAGLSIFLPGGDADNNNSIDISDFGILVNAYGSQQGDGTGLYDTRADFNCDNSVDVSDFGIFVNNYGEIGAP